jgi:putative flippase GtrA
MLPKRIYDRLPEGQQQFLKFCVVGGIGFIVDTGSLSILTRQFGLGPVVGRVISQFVFGMTTTFLLNRSLTFRDKRSDSVLVQYLRFALANGVGNLLNFGTHVVLVDNVAFFHRIPEMGIVVGTAIGLIFNFIGSKYFVFRSASPQP